VDLELDLSSASMAGQLTLGFGISDKSLRGNSRG